MYSTVILIANLTQREYRKWIVEIWEVFTRCNTSQRLADQSEMILKKGWYFYLEILEICGWINNKKYELDLPARIETLKAENPKPLNRTESQNTENRNTTDSSTTKTKVNKRRQNKCRVDKENHYGKENYFIISQEPTLERYFGKNRKSKQVITRYYNGNYHWIKRVNSCRSETSQ